MPIYDCVCEKCKLVTEELVKIEEEVRCLNCNKPMKKLPGGFFKLVYNNKTDMCEWGSGNYERSRYWDDVKAARSRGEKVKGYNED